GPGSSTPSSHTSWNGAVYFDARDSASGYEGWKTDGTTAGTVRLKDIYPGTAYSRFDTQPREFGEVGGGRCCPAIDGTVSGYKLWRTDGTEAGTFAISNSIGPRFLTRMNGLLYFAAVDVAGPGLWVSNGTSASRVKSFGPFGSNASMLADVNGT